MKIFIIHYKKLINRKRFIIEQLKKYNLLDYEFIQIDRDELISNELYKKYSQHFHLNYHNTLLSIFLSHFYAYKEVAEKYENALILEDDAILSDNFTNILDKYMNELPKDYDMLFIGDGCNLHIRRDFLIKNKYIYDRINEPTSREGCGFSRCTDSYIVSKKFAIKICEYFDSTNYQIIQPNDVWLNTAILDNKFKVYWAEPTIVTQGTENGLFKSANEYH